jgi:hypothetical protein
MYCTTLITWVVAKTKTVLRPLRLAIMAAKCLAKPSNSTTLGSSLGSNLPHVQPVLPINTRHYCTVAGCSAEHR